MPQVTWTMLAMVLLTSCSAGVPPRGLGDEAPPSEGLFPQGTLLVGPGPTDVTNRFLPAVMLSTVITDAASGKKYFKPCSGVLVHKRLVLTAGHCVCLSRIPKSDEDLLAQPSQSSSALRPGVLRKAAVLQGSKISQVLDKNSQCAKTTVVTATRYKLSPSGTPGAESERHEESEVLIHPQIEIISRESHGKPETLWANADLAVVFLKTPVELAFSPLQLPTQEIQRGEDVIIIGYGPGEAPDLYGVRQFGQNRVTRIIPLDTGSVIFRVEQQILSNGQPGATVEEGDSGGPVVRQTYPDVLMGITSLGARAEDGRKMSIFMSTYSHRPWLDEMLQRARKTPPVGGTAH